MRSLVSHNQVLSSAFRSTEFIILVHDMLLIRIINVGDAPLDLGLLPFDPLGDEGVCKLLGLLCIEMLKERCQGLFVPRDLHNLPVASLDRTVEVNQAVTAQLTDEVLYITKTNIKIKTRVENCTFRGS